MEECGAYERALERYHQCQDDGLVALACAGVEHGRDGWTEEDCYFLVVVVMKWEKRTIKDGE